MSSELQRYIETAIDKKENLLNAEVISFPKVEKVESSTNLLSQKISVWKLNDKSNVDQLRAVVGICFIFIALIVMGLYSNFL
tara:strand:+ start:2133 stop:2378 length:246 start_codon:yes stop_codon:yes gene_type:complete